jgi:hypothetical protein
MATFQVIDRMILQSKHIRSFGTGRQIEPRSNRRLHKMRRKFSRSRKDRNTSRNNTQVPLRVLVCLATALGNPMLFPRFREERFLNFTFQQKDQKHNYNKINRFTSYSKQLSISKMLIFSSFPLPLLWAKHVVCSKTAAEIQDWPRQQLTLESPQCNCCSNRDV